jgi:eukaryotic-like serine/threonine-protein kinase
MSESESAQDLISNLAFEFAERYRRGERPPLDEYTERYPELATQIRELFPALVVMEQFGSVAGEPTPQAGNGAIPKQLGEYRILREIGRGGMGIVYEAVQESLGRHVALKVLPLHQLLAQTHRERFEREAKAAARLHHTNIVPVFGIGMHEGIHYYAMQYIQGQALDTVLQEVRHLRSGEAAAPRQPLAVSIAEELLTGAGKEAPAATATPVTRSAAQSATSISRVASSGQSDLTGSSYTRYFAGVARMGIQVADALAYAHSLGTIHRDIKPSNLLLDRQGATWITDFGLVKDEGGSDLTIPGDIVGTIRYMAPERLDNQGDSRSDIYGLGATLFEMLTLRPAFPGERRLELMDQVRHVEPPRPRQIDPRIPRDLETVVLKAMAKEPARRYQSASQMAEDLRRFLADRPVRARRSTILERVWRWCRRNPIVALLTTSVVMLLLVLLTGAWVSNARLKKQLDRADRALDRADRAEKEKTDKLWESLLASAQASRWSGQPGRRFKGLDAVRQAAAIRTDLCLRNEVIALLTLPDVRHAKELPAGLPPGSSGLTFDPDFEYYARSDLKGNISIRRVADDEEVQRLPGFGAYTYQMKFSPDGRYLSAYYTNPSSGRIWDWRSAQVVFKDATNDFSPDGTRFAMMERADFSTGGTGEAWLAIYELPSAKVVKRVRIGPRSQGPTWYRHSINANGNLLAIASSQSDELKIVDLDSEKVVRTLPWKERGFVAWQSGDTRLMQVGADRMTICDTRTWAQETVLDAPNTRTTTACFSPRDDLVVSLGGDGRLRLWNPTMGLVLFALPGAGVPQFSRDGSRLASTVVGTSVQIWEVAGIREYRVLRTPREPNSGTWQMHFSPDGSLLATTGGGGARIWDVATGRDLADLPTGICSGIVFAGDGRTLFTRTAAGLERWPIRADATGLTIGPLQRVAALEWAGDNGTFAHEALAPAGQKLVANLRSEGVVVLLDPQDPAGTVKLPDHIRPSNALAVSPDGRWVAAKSWWDLPDKLRVSDVRSQQVVWPYRVNTPGTFSPDSRWLVTGGDACRIWETGTWRLDRTIETPPGLGTVSHAAFAPDGVVLAISYEAAVVRLVDSRTGQELATLPGLDMPSVDRVCFSPDGSRLACSIDAIGVVLWDLHYIRSELAKMNLDWDSTPFPPAPAPSSAIKVQVLP